MKNWKVPIWYKRKNINFRDFQVFCSSYYFSMFGSKWKKSSKNYKIPKKKETITLQCGFIRKKYQFPRFQSFWFCSILKIENCEISENFILLKFLVVYETQSRKNDFNFTVWFEKEKCPFPRISGFRFCTILEIENLETSESFRLLQFFIVLIALSMGKIKTFHWISN